MMLGPNTNGKALFKIESIISGRMKVKKPGE